MTTIEWTDETWNPVTGCTKVSTGCKNCYAEKVADRFWGGRAFTDVRMHEDRLEAPLHWRKPRRVFVNSMSDLFHDAVSDEFIDRVFAVMALAPQHTFQILTKRPQRMRDYLKKGPRANGGMVIQTAFEMQRDRGGDRDARKWSAPPWPLPNVWLGASCENQETADERIPLLLETPAAVRFLSCEPLLGPIRLDNLRDDEVGARWTAFRPRGMREPCDTLGVDWVIAGGESGPGARPCDVAWIRSIVKQCKAAGVACFVKQLGAQPRNGEIDLHIAVSDRKGGDPAEWSEDLRVREFPNCVGAR